MSDMCGHFSTLLCLHSSLTAEYAHYCPLLGRSMVDPSPQAQATLGKSPGLTGLCKKKSCKEGKEDKLHVAVIRDQPEESSINMLVH